MGKLFWFPLKWFQNSTQKFLVFLRKKSHLEQGCGAVICLMQKLIALRNGQSCWGVTHRLRPGVQELSVWEAGSVVRLPTVIVSNYTWGCSVCGQRLLPAGRRELLQHRSTCDWQCSKHLSVLAVRSMTVLCISKLCWQSFRKGKKRETSPETYSLFFQ